MFQNLFMERNFRIEKVYSYLQKKKKSLLFSTFQGFASYMVRAIPIK